MSPIEKYHRDIEMGKVTADNEQALVVEHLQSLWEALSQPGQKDRRIFKQLTNILPSKSVQAKRPKGVYLWGGVGRGKTYLMDLLFDCVDRHDKLRTHFHRFMQWVHSELTLLQGEKNPLEKVAGKITAQTKLLCFDEFFVQDIGDAMILSGLFHALFERKIILVTTSNIHPDSLYENGLQRQQFLPTIELIKTNTNIVQIEPGTDYRLRSLSQARLYYSPITAETNDLLLKIFYELAPDEDEIHCQQVVEILGRELPSLYCGDDVVWFDFSDLCDGPRSVHDYIELAKLFHAIIVSNIPQLDSTNEDLCRRFITLVDELYDRRVKLIISAHIPINTLYTGEKLVFEFERTVSRLLEMQSKDYLSWGHRA